MVVLAVSVVDTFLVQWCPLWKTTLTRDHPSFFFFFLFSFLFWDHFKKQQIPSYLLERYPLPKFRPFLRPLFRSGMYELFGWCRLDLVCSAVLLAQVRSSVCQLSGLCMLDPACIICCAAASWILYASVVLLVQVRSIVYELSDCCKLDPLCMRCVTGAS